LDSRFRGNDGDGKRNYGRGGSDEGREDGYDVKGTRTMEWVPEMMEDETVTAG